MQEASRGSGALTRGNAGEEIGVRDRPDVRRGQISDPWRLFRGGAPLDVALR